MRFQHQINIQEDVFQVANLLTEFFIFIMEDPFAVEDDDDNLKHTMVLSGVLILLF
jgi:hypothetical protein